MIMKFLVKRYYSGYCTHEIEAKTEEKAYEQSKELPINQDEIIETLEEWNECDEVDIADSN